MATWIRRWLRRCLYIGVGALCLLALTAVVVQTPPGKALLAKGISGLVARNTSLRLEIKGITGLLPRHVHVESVEVDDPRGDLLTLHDVDLRVSVTQLLRGRIFLDRLQVGRLDLWKRPIPRQKWRIPRIPALPVWPHVQVLQVRNLVLGEEVLGRTASLSVTGRIIPVEGAAFPEASLEIVGLDSDATRATLSFSYDQGLPQVVLRLHDEVLLPALLQVASPVVADIDGRGPRADWKGSLRVDAGTDILLSGDARFMEGEGSTLLAKFSLDASKTPFLREHTAVSGERLDANLALSLDTRGQLEFQSCDITSSMISAGVEGHIQIEQKSADIHLQAAHRDISPASDVSEDNGAVSAKVEATLSGPFTDLVAVAKASVNDMLVLDARIAGAVENPLPLKGEIDIYPGRLPLTKITVAKDEVVEMSFDLAYDKVTGEAQVERLDLSGAGMRLSAQGHIAPHLSDVTLRGHLEADDLGALAIIPAQPIKGAVKADLEANTGDAGLSFSLNMAGTGLEVAPASVEDLTLALEGQCREWTTFPPKGMTLGLTSQVQGLVVSGRDSTDWKLEAEADVDDFGGLQVRSLLLTDGNARVEGQGAFDANTQNLEVSLQCAVEALKRLPTGPDAMPDGRLQASLDARGTLQPLALKVTVTGAVDALKGLPEPLAALAGGELHLAMDGMAAGGQIEFQSISLKAEAFSAEGTAVYDRKNGTVDAKTKMSLPDLRPLGMALDLPGAGAVSIEASLQGTPVALDGWADIRGTDIALGGISVGRVDATLQGRDLSGSKPEVTLKAVAETGISEMEANAVALLGGDKIDISSFALAVGNNKISGRAAAVPGTGIVEAEAKADLKDLAVLGGILGRPLEGSSEATVTIRDGVITADVRGRSLAYGKTLVEDLAGKLRMKQVKSVYSGTATVESKGVKAGPVLAETLEINLEGGFEEAGMQVQARGALNGAASAQSVSLKMAGRVFSHDRRMIVTEAQGGIGDFDFGLEEPFEIEGGSGDIILTPMSLRFGSGSLLLEGRQGKDSVSGRLLMEAFPLAAVGMFKGPALSGVLNGEITLGGTPASPTGNISLSVEDARVVLEAAEMPAPLTANIEAVLNPNDCSVSLKADMKEVLHLESQLLLPVRLRINPWLFDVPLETGLSGKTQFEVHTRQLFPALGLVEHYLDGTAVGNFTLAGGIADPELQGEAVMRGARYENSQSGTRLENLNVKVVAEGGALKLTECTASTGERGGMTASGEMLFLYDRHFPFSITATFQDARFADLEYLNGRMNGTVKAEGTLQDVLVKGDVRVTPVEVSIPEELPVKEPPALEVTEIKGGEVVNRKVEKTSGFGERVRLDIDCEIPNKAYARAPILDSEWGGKLHVGGTLAEMKIDGRIAVLRGHLDFLNRRFVLRDSALLFLDGSPEKPYLDMQAVVDTPNLSARLTLKGELDDLKMELSSDPVVPQDEILAQVLFGRNLSRLSPVQAIQLARVAAMFNRGFSGVPLFSGNINLPGIDRIDLRTGERADETAVGVGKYLTDSVYVEVEQGTTTSSGKVSVEVEVTPQISVKGDADAKERSGVGLFWKKDY